VTSIGTRPDRDGEHLILGATVRTLGAWPAGWRYPGAHSDPATDGDALRRLALAAESAKFDFLFFGDWLATAPGYEFTDPYLLARIEPFAAAGYLAAITDHIGLVVTANTVHSEPYTVARTTASLDLLSRGRIGLNLATGAEPRSASNFGSDVVPSAEDRLAAAAEFVDLVRALWDSWQDGAVLADVDSGQFIDDALIVPTNYAGRFHSSTGPLNVLRPPQGHPPVMLAGSSTGARQLSALFADLSLVSPPTLDDAIVAYADAKARAAASDRENADQRLLTPILPVVAETREEAWEIYDRLVDLVQGDDVRGNAPRGLPTNRSMRALAGALGVPLTGVQLDEAVPRRVGARFSELGKRLAAIVKARSGRTIAGERPISYRHLLVAHSVVAPVIVGSADDVATHLETWFRRSAVDGFTVLAPYLHEQFEAFTTLVVPELVSRGLFRADYEGSTLRDHLALPVPGNVHQLAPSLSYQ